MRTELKSDYTIKKGDIVYDNGGDSFFLFDSKSEMIDYLNANIINQWSRNRYRQQLYDMHDELYRRIWSTNEFITEPYISHGELVSSAATPSSPCHAEATAILLWYWATFTLIDAQVNSAQEGDSAADFFNSLPNFSYVH